jgi:hypothetical protein
MLTFISSRRRRRHFDAARVTSVADPYGASQDPSWRVETLYACARACALGCCYIPPSLFLTPHGDRDHR